MDGTVRHGDVAHATSACGRDHTPCFCSSLSAPQVDQDQQDPICQDAALHHQGC